MIIDEEFECLTDNLTEEGVREFVDLNSENLIHFYMIYESDSRVTELKTFEAGELQIPTRSTEIGDLMVIYTNKKIAVSLIEGNYRIGSVKLAEAVSIAATAKSIDGIFFQGTHSWFSVPNSTLQGGSSA
jgi:hypothetical protein